MNGFRERRRWGNCFLSLWRSSVRHGKCTDFQTQKLNMGNSKSGAIQFAYINHFDGPWSSVYKSFISIGSHGRVAHTIHPISDWAQPVKFGRDPLISFLMFLIVWTVHFLRRSRSTGFPGFPSRLIDISQTKYFKCFPSTASSIWSRSKPHTFWFLEPFRLLHRLL